MEISLYSVIGFLGYPWINLMSLIFFVLYFVFSCYFFYPE